MTVGVTGDISIVCNVSEIVETVKFSVYDENPALRFNPSGRKHEIRRFPEGIEVEWLTR